LLIEGKDSGLQVINFDFAFSQTPHHVSLVREFVVLVEARDGGVIVAVGGVNVGLRLLDGGAGAASLGGS
jgi:hypothetical protein